MLWVLFLTTHGLTPEPMVEVQGVYSSERDCLEEREHSHAFFGNGWGRHKPVAAFTCERLNVEPLIIAARR